MTFVEFIAPIRGGTNRSLVMMAMYYLHRYEQVESMRAEQIRTLLRNARISRARTMNVADVLSNSGHFVDSPGSDGVRRLWRLTQSGEIEVRRLLGLPDNEPEIEHDVAALSQMAVALNDEDVRSYVEEAVMCLQVGALRAAVVFLWAGAIRLLQEEALTLGGAAVTTAVRKQDPKARTISRVEDFAFIREKVALLAFGDLGMLDKSERGTLEDALKLRNSCGHPTKYRPGVKKVSSYVEDLLGIVFV
jgi:hypothetical protein